MLSRCRELPEVVDRNGKKHQAVTAPCCRVAGHAGDCHRHFGGRLLRDTVHTALMPSGQRVRCTVGAELDGISDP